MTPGGHSTLTFSTHTVWPGPEPPSNSGQSYEAEQDMRFKITLSKTLGKGPDLFTGLLLDLCQG